MAVVCEGWQGPCAIFRAPGPRSFDCLSPRQVQIPERNVLIDRVSVRCSSSHPISCAGEEPAARAHGGGGRHILAGLPQVLPGYYQRGRRTANSGLVLPLPPPPTSPQGHSQGVFPSHQDKLSELLLLALGSQIIGPFII